MSKYIVKRLSLAIIALLIISFVVYMLICLSPRRPVSISDFKTQKDYFTYIHAKGLDKSAFSRYILYMKSVFQGQFGQTYGLNRTQEKIPSLFFGPLRYTIIITAPSFFVAYFIGVILGVWAGYKRGTWVDGTINVFTMIFAAIPPFVLAAFGLIIAPKIGLPVSFIKIEDGGLFLMIKSIIVPMIVLVLMQISAATALTRNEVVSILESNHVLIARSKGLTEWNIFKKHVFRNMITPILLIFIGGFVVFISGSLVIETFFQVPGTSKIIVDSVSQAEYDIVMFNTLFFVLFGLVTAILVDVLYVFIDPRIRTISNDNWKFIQSIKSAIKRFKNSKVSNLPTNTSNQNQEETQEVI